MSVSDLSPNLGLPFLLASQSQKHVTLNESLVRLDNLLMLAVKSRNISTPPQSPIDGDRYIIAPNPTSEWFGHNNKIAAYNNLGWVIYEPKNGFIAYIIDENIFAYFNGENWQNLASGNSSLQNLPLLGIGTTADINNPFSAKLNDALLGAKYSTDAGSGDIRLKLNKESDAKNASLVFQNNWSGRSEFGLCGNDDFSIKVSPDGANWKTALVIDKASGAVSPSSLNHFQTGKPMGGYMPCSTTANSELYRIDEPCGANPRNVTISSKVGDIINLTTNDAYKFHNATMTFTSVRIWNKSKTPAQSAWVMASPTSSSLKITDAAHIVGWNAGDVIQLGDDAHEGTSFQCITLDISRLLIEKFGASFYQKGVILSSNIVNGQIGDVIDYSATGELGSLVRVATYGTIYPTAPYPCTEPSPISNSNLLRIRENFGGNVSIRLVRLNGVFG